VHQRVSQKRRRGPLLARLRAWPQYAARLITVDAPPQFLNKSYVDGLEPRFFDPAFKAACTTNMNSFKQMMQSLRGHYKDKDLSTLTLRDIFGSDDPSIINAIPREEFLARVRAKKQELDLRLTPIESEVAARRVERDARIGKYKLHAACSIAFPPEPQFWKAFFVHLSGCQPGKAGQQPTPVKYSSQYCPSKEACEHCQTWVQKVALETVSLETPGAGWAPPRDQVLDVAAKVRAALPSITFGGVELREAGPSKRGPTAPATRRSKRARKPPKSTED
jgi:hypothetical protein